MNNLHISAVTTASLFASLLAGSLPALAEETKCRGTIGAVALDNIFVPDGASCVLNRTRTNGSVVVGRGASLTAIGVSINGNIQAEGARSVVVKPNSMVGGSVQLKQGGSATIESSRINGDLQFESNNQFQTAKSNIIGGNLQAFQNSGGVTISNNRIKGNLQCKENIPRPTGGGNQASSKEDQCARL